MDDALTRTGGGLSAAPFDHMPTASRHDSKDQDLEHQPHPRTRLAAQTTAPVGHPGLAGVAQPPGHPGQAGLHRVPGHARRRRGRAAREQEVQHAAAPRAVAHHQDAGAVRVRAAAQAQPRPHPRSGHRALPAGEGPGADRRAQRHRQEPLGAGPGPLRGAPGRGRGLHVLLRPDAQPERRPGHRRLATASSPRCRAWAC